MINDINPNLISITDRFRQWVCKELSTLSSQERFELRGDYLFVIDKSPRFIVLVNHEGSWSLQLQNDSSFQCEAECPIHFNIADVQRIISDLHRVRVHLDSSTLNRLLLGTLKAKIAFLTGKVKIDGDLPAFMKMISLLKKKGVGPVVTSTNKFIENHVN